MAGSTYVLGIAFDVRIRRGVVLAPALVLFAMGLLARVFRNKTPRAIPLRPPRAGVLAARAAFGISFVIAVGLFASALTLPNVGFDGEMTWCTVARWVRADRSVTPRALTDSRVFVSHPRYPLLMPLAQVVVQETFDLGDDRRAIKPLYAAFFPAFLLVLFDIARRHAGTCAAALAVVALAVVPILTSNFGADGAFSDLPLGAFFGSGLLLLLGPARGSEIVAATLLLGAGVLTKNEGLPFAVAALAASAFVILSTGPPDRRRRVAFLAFAATGVLAAGIALSVWRARIPQRWDEDYLGRLGKVSLITEAGVRLPLLPAAVVREVTDRLDLAGFFLAGVVVLVAGAAGLRRRVVVPIVLALYYCLAAYVLALLLTTWPGVEQVHATWNRLMIQLIVPLGVLLALALRTALRASFAFRTATPHGVLAGLPPGLATRAPGLPRGLFLLVAFAVLPVILTELWALRLNPGGLSFWREDPSLTGGLDQPAEGASIHGRLEVRGWAREPGQDLRVTVLLDGKERASSSASRVARPDVQNALPSLGDCSSAGYEFSYVFSAEDAGPHDLDVLFRGGGSRERHYPVRRFSWQP